MAVADTKVPLQIKIKFQKKEKKFQGRATFDNWMLISSGLFPGSLCKNIQLMLEFLIIEM